MLAKEIKPKKCKAPGCGKHFKPAMTTQKVCSIACALAVAKEPKAQKVAAKAITRQKREDLKERREKLKSKGDHLREAQQAFNAYIRERDRLEGHCCISSGRPLDWNGNAVDAGHYRSVGSAPHLRFNEMNCNAQSKHDNRYLSGNVAEYRLGLIARYGLEAVEALERDQSVRRYTIEDLQAIKAEYRAKIKALKEAA
ncbi:MULTISPECIES: recombination protein NinG [Pseudomonas]|uniref:recombination protein NinG n=1 Tax=Pseudomonas TaxID=286 RepID=UPI0002A15CFE|nr:MULTISPECIES: recombination protein NinG [Pseudomonas]AGA72961.1 bacteriophage lambda NinG family protein [Pseudomonas putida HB3267]MCE0946224.1 recombination protein NinG [Pseudomonas asiatica]MCE1102275.1 recombination protein NinG [Pseudomonas asiatica]MCE1107837.1 recombination protein NinG [Pseudomonas asiatica]WJR25010.1 recombination protein NinG [Pseudomonas asiatica]